MNDKEARQMQRDLIAACITPFDVLRGVVVQPRKPSVVPVMDNGLSLFLLHRFSEGREA